jgi:hypothetical protein
MRTVGQPRIWRKESGLMAANVGSSTLREIETLFALGAIGSLSDG